MEHDDHVSEEATMNVLTTAKTLGLTADDNGDLSGTIEEALVLAALEEFSAALPDHADLFILASDRVRTARSAGLEVLDEDSVFGRFRDSNQIQLRYRGEMADMFTDLAIDLAMRGVTVSDSDSDSDVTATV